MKHTRILTIVGVLIAAFMLIACEPPIRGMFAGLEDEEVIANGNLSDGASPTSMIRHNNRYYISAGSMFQRSTSSSSDTPDWSSVSLPSGYTQVVALLEVSSTPYAVVVNSSTPRSGMFSFSTDGNGNTTFDTTNRLPSAAQSRVVQYAEALNTRAFVAYGLDSPSRFDLISVNIATPSSPDVVYADGALPIDATWDGTDYRFLLSDQNIHTAAEASITGGTTAPARDSLGLSVVSSIDSIANIRGITHSSVIGGLIITGSSSADADNHTVLSIIGGNPDPSTVVFETDLEYGAVVFSTLTDRLLVGTTGAGYRQVLESGGNLSWSSNRASRPPEPEQSFDTSGLSTSTVLDFFEDSTDNYIFALTSGSGIFRGSYDSTAQSITWARE